MYVFAGNNDFFLKERGDPAVEKSFEAAKTKLNVFLDALKIRDSENSKYDYYGAYLKFTEEEIVEYLWLADVQEYKDLYIGVIISEPRLLSDIKHGVTIAFRASDIYDWQLSEKQTGKIFGAFLACATSHLNQTAAAQPPFSSNVRRLMEEVDIGYMHVRFAIFENGELYTKFAINAFDECYQTDNGLIKSHFQVINDKAKVYKKILQIEVEIVETKIQILMHMPIHQSDDWERAGIFFDRYTVYFYCEPGKVDETVYA